MAQVTSGFRSLLSSPGIYDAFQNMLGARQGRTRLAADHVRARPGERVLDLGCGTAQMLEFLPAVDYYGVDGSEGYIDAARQRFGARGTFHCGDVTGSTLGQLPSFDIVLAVAVLHHLDDAGATALFALARSALRAGGRMVTMDPCYTNPQSPVARFVISRDRGRNIRSRDGYRALACGVFARVEAHVRTDLSRIPYTHLVMECTAGR